MMCLTRLEDHSAETVRRVGRSQLATVLLLIGLLVWGWVDVRERATRDTHRTDVTVYTTAGAALFNGDDPYAATSPRGWHYLYPPLFALLMSPLSSLAHGTQAMTWFTISVLICCGCYRECRAILRIIDRETGFSRHQSVITWVGLATWIAALLPIANTLQRGQVGIAVLYPLLLGARLILQRSRRGMFVAGVVLAFPVTLKLTPIMPVGYLVLQQLRLRRSATEPQTTSALISGLVVGLMCFVFVLPAAATGWKSNLQHLQTWCQRVVMPVDAGEVNSFTSSSTRNQSLANSVAIVLRQPAGTRLPSTLPSWFVRIAKGALLALLLLTTLQSQWLDTSAGRMAGFGLSCGMSLMISPLSWSHHYTLLIPAILFASVRLATTRSRHLALVAAIVPVILIGNHYLSLHCGLPSGLLGLGTALWLIATCCLGTQATRQTANNAARWSTPGPPDLFRTESVVPR